MGIMSSLFRPSVGAITRGELRGAVPWLLETEQVGRGTAAGVNITEDSALTLSAVFGAVRAISEDVAKLPFGLFERIGHNDIHALDDDPLHALVAIDPNPEMTPFDLRQAIVANAIMWHGGYAEIERDGSGNARHLWPIHPRRVRPRRDEITQEIVYEVRELAASGRPDRRDIPSRDMIHVRGFNTTGLVGFMITEYAKESLGIAKAAEQFSATFFGNGATTSGIVSFEGAMKPETATETRRRIGEHHTGPANAWKPIILDNGAKWQPTSVDAEKSQLNESLMFRVEDIARWFRIPPHKLQHLLRATFSNIEEQSIEYVGDAVMPWLVRVEQEFRKKLIIPQKRTRVVFQHDMDPLIQVRTSERIAAHAVAVNNGIMSRNEVRAKEGLNPYPGGDQFVVQQNLATVSEGGEIVPNNTTRTAGSAVVPDSRAVTDAHKVAMMPVFVDAASRMIEREAKAITGRKAITAEWLDKFYEGHREAVAGAFAAPVATLAKIANVDADGIAAWYADRHVAESRRRLAAGESPTTWLVDRPAKIAETLTNEVCNVEK